MLKLNIWHFTNTIKYLKPQNKHPSRTARPLACTIDVRTSIPCMSDCQKRPSVSFHRLIRCLKNTLNATNWGLQRIQGQALNITNEMKQKRISSTPNTVPFSGKNEDWTWAFGLFGWFSQQTNPSFFEAERPGA